LFLEVPLNKSAVSNYELGEEPMESEYWMSRTPEERIFAIEFLRQQFSEYGPESRLERVCRIMKIKEN